MLHYSALGIIWGGGQRVQFWGTDSYAIMHMLPRLVHTPFKIVYDKEIRTSWSQYILGRMEFHLRKELMGRQPAPIQ